MVIIEEAQDHQHKVTKCKKRGGSSERRRCYAVKVCIEKNPSTETLGKCANAKIQVDPTCHVVKKHISPCCPPEPFQICTATTRPTPICKKRTKKRRTNKCRDIECQTPNPPPCLRKERDVQCSLPKCMQDIPCQTNYREVKHCGNQISTSLHTPCNAKHCQTELENSCGVESVCHDRTTCANACYKKANEKRDAACQPCWESTNQNDNCRKNGRNKAACEPYEFPFVGRTSSGNLKVRPCMVSYENKEFGILVANPNCIRTSVKRISSCDMIYHRHQEEPPCSSPPPPCFPKQLLCRPVCSPCSSKESCKTAQPWLPPPISPHHQHHHHHHRHHHHKASSPHHPPCNHPFYQSGDDQSERADLEILQPHYYNHPTRVYERTHISQKGLGHADGWNYVNPEYQYQKNKMPPQKPVVYPVKVQRDPSNKRVGVSESRIMQVKPTRKNGPAAEGYLDTGLSEPNPMIGSTFSYYNYNDNAASGTHNLELAERIEPNANHDERSVPYVPPFPQEEMRQHPSHQQQMPDGDDEEHGDGYHTPTEEGNHKENGFSIATGLSHSASARQPTVHPSSQRKMMEPSTMHGRLHYVVKGTVDPDATVTVGDAVFPVSSVVLEIRSKHPAEYDDEQQMPGVIENVRLPEFNALPITYQSSGRQETVHHIPEDNGTGMMEDLAHVKSERESRRHISSKHSAYERVMEWDNNELPPPPSQYPSSRAMPAQNQPTRPVSHSASETTLYQHPSSTQRMDDQRLGRSQSHTLPVGYFSQEDQQYQAVQSAHRHMNPNSTHPSLASQHFDSQGEMLTPCQSCRSNNTQFQKAPPSRNFSESQTLPESSDYVESKNPVPIQSQSTELRIAEPNSSMQLDGTSSPTEESIVGLADHHHHEPPEDMPRKDSEEMRREEEEIGPEAGTIPNLDVIRDAVLLFGGINPKLPCTQGNSAKYVYMYTRDTDEWTEVGAIPHPRTHFGLARVANSIYVIGGTDPEHKDGLGKSKAVHTNLRLNLRSGKWGLDTGLDTPRSHCGCVALGKLIFVIGGNIESRATSSCLVFDTESHAWNSIASLDTTRSNMGICAFDNGILVAGGTSKNAKKPVLETVQYYEPTLDSWTVWKSLPSPRAFCSLAVTHSKKIYLIAGAGLRDLNKRKNSSLADILQLDIQKNEWVRVGALHHSRHGHATAVLENDSVLIMGGISSHTAGAINRVEIWNPSRGHSSEKSSLRHSHSGMAALTL